MKLSSLILLLVLFSGCATELTDKGRQVELVDLDPEGCNYLGTVSAEDWFAGSRETVENKLRNQAADKGANVAVIDTSIASGRDPMTALIYGCVVSRIDSRVGGNKP